MQAIRKSIHINSYHKIIYLAIYMVIICAILLLNIYTSQLDFLADDNSVYIQPSSFDNDFSTYELSTDDANRLDYAITLPKDTFQHLDGDLFKLVFNNVHSNAMNVWFNDQLIISEGDITEGLSMLRAGFVHGTIDRRWIQDTNTLSITTYASYRTGTSAPVIISENIPGNRNISLLRLFNERLVALGIGLVIMSGLFALFIYFLNRKDNVFLLWLSLATLFTGGYLWDYLTMQHLSFDYLIVKKIFLLSLSIGIFFYGLALYSLVKKKYILSLPLAQVIYYLFIFFISTNMIDFRIYYNYFYFSIIGVVFFLLVVTFKHYKLNNKAFVMLLHYSTIFMLGIISLTKGFKISYFSLATPIFIIFTIGFLPLIFTYVLFLEKDIKILRERDQKLQAVNQAMTDGLTGTYNNHYLKQRLARLNDHSVLAIVDLDNMKQVNDNYGHLAGDYVLCHLTEIIQRYLRDQDALCRYGGDEFVIIFEDCSLKEASKIANKIRNDIKDNAMTFNKKHLTTTISIGMCRTSSTVHSKNIIECADNELYKAKRKGKNQISVS